MVNIMKKDCMVVDTKTKNYLVHILFFTTLIGFIAIPFTGDLMAFMGGAIQADYVGENILINSIKTWDLKGAFLRLQMYIIYLLASSLVGGTGYLFTCVCLFLYALEIIVINYFIILLIEKRKCYRLFYVEILSIFFFSTQVMCKMQAEMTCVQLLMLAFAVYINALRKEKGQVWKLFISGSLIGSVFFYKSNLLLLSVCIVAMAFLWEKKEKRKIKLYRYFVLAIGSISFILLCSLVILLINPLEYSNILMAASYQGTIFSVENFSLVNTVYAFGIGFLSASVGMPIILIGSVCAIVNLIDDIKIKAYDKCIVRIILWMIPACYVIIANLYFIYHYTCFFLPSIFELGYKYAKRGIKIEKTNIRIIPICIYGGLILLIKNNEAILYNSYTEYLIFLCIICIIFVCVIACILHRGKGYVKKLTLGFILFIYINYISIFSINAQNYIFYTNEMYEKNKEINMQNDSGEILYLDDGVGAYLLGYKSYLKEFYPLPLQRIHEKNEKSELGVYQEALKNAMKYEGKYISVYEKWFFKDGNNTLIRDKIEKEYMKIGEYAVYSVAPNLFDKTSENSMRYYGIYERVDN